MIENIARLDFRIIHFINRLRNPVLDYFNVGVTYLGSDVFALGVILALILLPQDFFRPFAVQGALTLVISTLVVQIMKRLVRRKRPFEHSEKLRSIRIGVDPFSFPSGHTTAAFGLATSINLIIVSPLIQIIFVTLAFLVGFSRVYLAVHYPSDVIAGGIIGSAFALLVHALSPALGVIIQN